MIPGYIGHREQRSLSFRPAGLHRRTAPGQRAPVRHAAQPWLRRELGRDQPVACGPLPPPADPRQVPGEDVGAGGYHYYPARDQAHGWLTAAGFRVEDEHEADYYRHFLLERR